MEVASPIVAGLAGGPVGVVSGIVLAGVKLAQKRQQFEALKTALLKKPFDPLLLPTVVDGTAVKAALDISPLMKARLGAAPPGVATELMRMVVSRTADGPEPSLDLATRLMENGFGPGVEPFDFHASFASIEELAEALEEYRSGLVFHAASAELSESVEIPPLAGQPAATLDLRSLASATLALREDPQATSQIERLVFLAEALGKLPSSTGSINDLVVKALGAGLDLANVARATTQEVG